MSLFSTSHILRGKEIWSSLSEGHHGGGRYLVVLPCTNKCGFVLHRICRYFGGFCYSFLKDLFGDKLV